MINKIITVYIYIFMTIRLTLFQHYQAVYAFSSSSELEVDLAEGQTVKVIQQHDLDGNSEWWLVESEKRQGYVPANYLYKIKH